MGLLSSKDMHHADEMANDFHLPCSKNALIIFTRNPELGKCKTRLAKTIGNHAALEIYNYLLKHTATVSKQVAADRYVFYSEHIKKEDVWDISFFRKKLQYGTDLGERMENAFSALFQLRYEKVVIIGSDLLDLDTKTIEEAFHLLYSKDYVIGPAKDGGYYLLGMKTLHSNLFKNKVWGTNTVLHDSLKDLQKCNVGLLKELNDIDTFEDILPYESLKNYYTT